MADDFDPDAYLGSGPGGGSGGFDPDAYLKGSAPAKSNMVEAEGMSSAIGAVKAGAKAFLNRYFQPSEVEKTGNIPVDVLQGGAEAALSRPFSAAQAGVAAGAEALGPTVDPLLKKLGLEPAGKLGKDVAGIMESEGVGGGRGMGAAVPHGAERGPTETARVLEKAARDAEGEPPGGGGAGPPQAPTFPPPTGPTPPEPAPERPVAQPRPGLEPNVRLLPPDLPVGQPVRDSVGAARATSALENASPEAVRILEDAARSEGWTEHTLDQLEEEQSPHHFLAESSPNFEQLTKSNQTLPGPARTEINQAVNQRHRERAERTNAIHNEYLGQDVDRTQWDATLRQAAQRESSPFWRQFDQQVIQPTPEIDAVLQRPTMKKALAAANRTLLDRGQPIENGFPVLMEEEGGNSMRPEERAAAEQQLAETRVPTAKAFQLAKEHLDGLIADAVRSGRRGDVRTYTGLKHDLDAAIAAHPNADIARIWQQARQTYRGPMALINAREIGEGLLGSRTHYTEVPGLIEGMSPQERAAVQLGLRNHMSDVAGRTGATTELRNIREALGADNRRKIAAVIGPERAEAYFNALQQEEHMHFGPRRLTQGSDTAGNIAYQQLLQPPGTPTILSRAVDIAGKALHPKRAVAEAAMDAIRRGDDAAAGREAQRWQGVRADLGRLLTTQGPERDAIRRALVQRIQEGEGGLNGPVGRQPLRRPGSPGTTRQGMKISQFERDVGEGREPTEPSAILEAGLKKTQEGPAPGETPPPERQAMSFGDTTRRNFLKGVAATGVAAAKPGPITSALKRIGTPERLIDIEAPRALARQAMYSFKEDKTQALDYLFDNAKSAKSGTPAAKAYEGAIRHITSGAIDKEPGIWAKSVAELRAHDEQVRAAQAARNVAEQASSGTGEEPFRGRGELPRSEGQLEAPRGADSEAREPEPPLEGLPTKVTVPGIGKIEVGPHQPIRDLARQYMADAGLPYNPPKDYAKVDPVRARRIADEYEKMPHAPDDPKVKAAYKAMADETMAQWNAIKKSGFKAEFIPPGSPDPYAASPRLAVEDIKKNNHMWVFSTRDGFGTLESFDPSTNPLLADTGEVISGQPALVNDIFRIVHDYFGHAKEGVGFRADGEENAWRSHAAMYSPLARKAMTSETRGQNSWLNYGPYGDANRTAKTEGTVFADQKTGVMPDWVVNEGSGQAERKPLLRSATARDASGRPTRTAPIPIGTEDKILQAGFDRSRGPVFYSGVQKAIDSAKQTKAPANQWLGILKNASGVGREEMQWLGLEDWLKDQKGPVTKQQISDYVRANQIEVKEVTKGGPALSADERGRLHDYEGRLEEGERLGPADQAEYDRLNASHNEDQPKFASYQLPGGENYRELLLTLPLKTSPKAAEAFELTRRMQEGDFNSLDDAGRRALFARRDQLLRDAKAEEGDAFKSSHFDEPNILAHVRFNDRTIDGKKTLFVEEVQSDWHQAGKKKGYQEQLPELSAEERKQLGNERRRLSGEIDDLMDARPRTQQHLDQAQELQRRMDDIGTRLGGVRNEQGVPDAPFKTTWPELAMKRMIRYAAENGYDKVAWTTGETQAARYDLSKQVNSIKVTSPNSESHHIDLEARSGVAASATFDKSGKITKGYDAFRDGEGKHLSDYIGKEMADKILKDIETNKYQWGVRNNKSGNWSPRFSTKDEAQSYQQNLPESVREDTEVRKMVPKHGTTYSGLDLKVGGEGMKGFYDQILPATVNRLVKKFGARVGKGKLKAPDTDISDEAFHRWARRRGADVDDDSARETFEEEVGLPETKKTDVHTVDITPRLRESTFVRGLPQFSSGGAVKPPMSARKKYHYANDRGTKAKHCGNCSMFRKPHGCTAVGGFIAPVGKCDIWDARAHRADGGSTFEDRAERSAPASTNVENRLNDPPMTSTESEMRRLRSSLTDQLFPRGQPAMHREAGRMSSDAGANDIGRIHRQIGGGTPWQTLMQNPWAQSALWPSMLRSRTGIFGQSGMGQGSVAGPGALGQPAGMSAAAPVTSPASQPSTSLAHAQPPAVNQGSPAAIASGQTQPLGAVSAPTPVNAGISTPAPSVSSAPPPSLFSAENPPGQPADATSAPSLAGMSILGGSFGAPQPSLSTAAAPQSGGQLGMLATRARGGKVEPTDAQKEAGNYEKRHIRIHGLDVSIENERGSTRNGAGRDGKRWSVRMPYHYGYIRRTEGADGDHVDVCLGPHPRSPHVFVVDQKDAETGKFDEHKVMLGFGSAAQARTYYKRGFSDGKGHQRLGHMTEMTVEQFKRWLKETDDMSWPAKISAEHIKRAA